MNNIDKKILIILEGSTDKSIINNIIKKNNLFDGKDIIYFPKEKNKEGIILALDYIKSLKTIPEVTTKKLNKILIIVDADEYPEKRFKNILKILEEQREELKKFDIDKMPEKCGEFVRNKGKVGIGVFLFPDNKVKGSIETLCIKALKHNKLEKFLSCIEKYIECYKCNCIENEKELIANKRDKIKFRVYIHTIDPERYQPCIDKEVNYKDKVVFKDLISFLEG